MEILEANRKYISCIITNTHK